MRRRHFLLEISFFPYPHKLQNLFFHVAPAFFLCACRPGRYDDFELPTFIVGFVVVCQIFSNNILPNTCFQPTEENPLSFDYNN
jgi:hypothetical protein